MGEIAVENGAGKQAFAVGNMDDEPTVWREDAMQFLHEGEEIRLGEVFEDIEGYDYAVGIVGHSFKECFDFLAMNVLKSEMPR